MKKKINKKQITMVSLVAALGVAVYLNWQYASADVPELESQLLDVNAQVSEDIINEQEANKNYGDAQLVSASGNDSNEYFETARLTRSKSRDEALEKLQESLKDAKLSGEEKDTVTQELSDIIESIATESDIENLVKAKGFDECVVYISSGKADVTVKCKSGDLTKEQVSQIKDIILNKSKVKAQDITIVEVE